MIHDCFECDLINIEVRMRLDISVRTTIAAAARQETPKRRAPRSGPVFDKTDFNWISRAIAPRKLHDRRRIQSENFIMTNSSGEPEAAPKDPSGHVFDNVGDTKQPSEDAGHTRKI